MCLPFTHRILQGTPQEPLRNTVGPANTAAARARRLLHEASVSLALEKILSTKADYAVRILLLRWHNYASMPQVSSSRRARAPESIMLGRPAAAAASRHPLALVGDGDALSAASLRADMSAARGLLAVPTLGDEGGSRREFLAQEALLAKELDALERELSMQRAGEGLRRADMAEESEACYAVREALLAGEVVALEAEVTASREVRRRAAHPDAFGTRWKP